MNIFDRKSCVYKSIMSMVLGEDPESEEEIDTSQLDQISSTPSKDARSKIPRGEVVAGEESETDEEDNTEETVTPLSFVTSTPHSPSPDPAHDTSLHKKLRDSNISLHEAIVTRVNTIYQATIKNLTQINDNLTKAQTVIEKVNAQVKRSDGSIKKTNEEIRAVIAAANNFAPTLRMDITMFTPPKQTELTLESI